MWIFKNRFLAFLSALLILMAGSGICSAAEIVVHNGESIRDAIGSGSNNSTTVIIVEPGTYEQTISINMDRSYTYPVWGDVIIKSSTGNPDDVVIQSDISAFQTDMTIRDITIKGSAGGQEADFIVENCKIFNGGLDANWGSTTSNGNTFINCEYATSVGEFGSIYGKDNTFIDCKNFVGYSEDGFMGEFKLKNSTRIRTDSSGKQVITIIPIINLTYPNGNTEIPVNSPTNNTTDNPTPEPTPAPTEEKHHGGGSSGGSGGGASGGSPEPAKNVASKDTTKTFVPNGKPVTFNFTNQVTVVNFITFESGKTMGKITAITEDLKNQSTLVKTLPEGEIYKSFNVWVGNAGYGESDNILNATLNFKVEKSWMDEKNVDSSEIVLYKYDSKSKEWVEIPVTVTNEDDQFVYFKADVPGFSSFAIVGKSSSQLAEEPTTEPANGEIRSAGNGTIAKGMTKESSGFGFISGVIGLLGVFYRIRGR